MDYNKATKLILESYFSQPNVVVNHQINSFNFLIDKILDQLVNDDLRTTSFTSIPSEGDKFKYGISRIHHSIDYLKLESSRPFFQSGGEKKPLYPLNALRQDSTYATPLSLTFRYRLYYEKVNGEKLEKPEIDKTSTTRFVNLPVMVGSKLCNLTELSKEAQQQLGEDPYSIGGYFVINGKKLAIVFQERICQNIPHISKSKEKSSTVEKIKKNKNATISQRGITLYDSYEVEIRSRKEKDFDRIDAITVLYDGKNNNIAVLCNAIVPYYIPISIIFRILGINSDKDIIEIIMGKKVDSEEEPLKDYEEIILHSFLLPALQSRTGYVDNKVKFPEIINIKTAQDYFCELFDVAYPVGYNNTLDPEIRLKKNLLIFNNRFITNINNPYHKAIHFGRYILRHLLISITTGYGLRDRDSFTTKRVESAGSLIAQLLKQLLDQITSQIRKTLNELMVKSSLENFKKKVVEENHIENYILEHIPESALITPFDTGKWETLKLKSSLPRYDVTLRLEEQSVLNFYSDLNHILALAGKTSAKGKNITARDLHSSHIGYICPIETPEGGTIGFLKNKAMTAFATVGADKKKIKLYINNFKGYQEYKNVLPCNYFEYYTILLNYKLIGFVKIEDAHKFKNYIISGKRSGEIDIYLSIAFDWEFSEIRINCDIGRLTRPLLIVENGKLLIKEETIKALLDEKISWMDLLTNDNYRCIEYVDSDELYYTGLVAENISKLMSVDKELFKYTHCEINPEMILGNVACVTPSLHMSVAQRIMFQTAMLKQGLGMISRNYYNLFLKDMKILKCPAIPLTTTNGAKLIRYDTNGNGFPIMIAIASYTGYNQDDSTIVDSGAIDKGLFWSSIYRTFSQQIESSDEVMIPNSPNISIAPTEYSYRNLDQNGIIKIGSYVEYGDILIGVVRKIDKDEKVIDVSLIYSKSDVSIVVEVLQTIRTDSYVVYKVKTKEERKPEIGDKGLANGGQKGTISMKIPSSSMFFNKSGQRPSFILSPMAYPKRETINHIIEVLAGTISGKIGQRLNLTAFGDITDDMIVEALKQLNIPELGKQTVYNGFTGKKMKTKIFMGLSYYRVLRHMVSDKIHARDTGGQVQSISRQPPEGRSKKGGNKLGTMEKDALLGHGATGLQQSLFYDNSDGAEFYYCSNCGYAGVGNDEEIYYKCPVCKRTKVSKTKIGYCSKLFQQYLFSCGMGMEFHPDDKN